MSHSKPRVSPTLEQNARPQKRKLEEAFRETCPKQDQIRKINKQSSNKVVNFLSDEYESNAATTASVQVQPNSSVNGGAQSNLGRLKRRAQTLLETRKTLPIFPHADEIRSKLITNDILLLVGETGSGKSTQIPQFLLDQNYARRTSGKNGVGKVGGCVAITQPRRVAAISLARRVAEEMGSPLGNTSPASQVGYSVRFDTSVGPNTCIKFLTDGMLLQELLRDPWLKEYSVVVVDEVHERGVNVDLVMGFLRRIVQGRSTKDGRGGVPLKIVVMSATADMERIEKFFKPGQKEGQINGVNGANEEYREEFEGFSDHETTRPASETAKITTPQQDRSSIRTVSCFIKGRQYPVTVNYTTQPVSSTWDATMERIIQIHQHTPLPGDVLVFLPGQEAIDSVESMCNSYSERLYQQSKQKGAPKVPKLLILPLFAALPTAAQQRVFEQTPPFTRKVILSTNIAETSVTVPGIRHVIDTGKRKARFFRPSLNLDTLLVKSISRSSAKQRAGRAGREAPGSCWRLYTEQTFYELDADTEPEILRCDLSQLVLTLKAHDIDDILSFPLLTQPPVKALERALLHLLHLKALDPKTGHITPLGRQMSSLPLPANLARILLASLEPQYDCLDPIIDIVSGLSVENIWLPIHNKARDMTASQSQSKNVPGTTATTSDTNNNNDDEEDDPTNPIEAARRTLYRRSGDHLTLLAAIQAYTAENSDRKSWCRQHGISHRAMTSAMDVRKQLVKLMGVGGRYRPSTTTKTAKSKVQATTMENSTSQPQSQNQTKASSLDTRILRTLLTGLHTNTAHLTPHALPSSATSSTGASSSTTALSAPYRTYYTSKPIQIHPSSVLFSRERGSRPLDIMFSEFVFTARPYARGVSEVEGRWVEEAMREEQRGGEA